MSRYAAVLNSTRDAKRVRELTHDVWNRRRRTLGDNHPDTLTAAREWAVQLLNTNRNHEARFLLGGILSKQRQIFESHHKDILKTSIILASALQRIGSIARAKELARKAAHQINQDYSKDRVLRQWEADILQPILHTKAIQKRRHR
jgi:hypothetical protein